MRLFSNSRLLIFFCLIAAAIIVLAYNSNRFFDKEKIANLSNDLVPIESLNSSIFFSLNDCLDYLGSFFIGAEKKRELIRENADLKQYLFLYKQSEEDNKQLREELNFVENIKPNYISADVIARNNNALHQKIVINAGAKQGIKKWQLAVFRFQLVGRVIEVNQDSAVILLLNDVSSRIPVISINSKNIFLAAGESTNNLSCKYLNQQAVVDEGELVKTYANDLDIKPGIIVGTIYKDKNNCYIKPTTDFNKLQFVHIITQ